MPAAPRRSRSKSRQPPASPRRGKSRSKSVPVPSQPPSHSSSSSSSSRSIVKSTLFFLFVASLSTFFLAILFEHFRLPILAALADFLSLDSTTIESLIIFPCVLLMPITHIVGTLRYNNENSLLSLLSSPLRGSLTFLILQAVTWTLWTIALCILIIAVFHSPGIMGSLSGAAVLGLFSEGIMITSIFAYDDKAPDDIASSPESDLTPDHLVKAADWGSARSRSRRPLSSSFIELRKKRRKRDFLLFCGMSFALMQTPYIFSQVYKYAFKGCVECLFFGVSGARLSEVPAAFALLTTLSVPIFSHGVGGILFHPASWSFHHPLEGGATHVRFQAAGWTILAIAGCLQLFNLVFGTTFDFLLHSGNALGWVAEGLLLYSLFRYDEGQLERKSQANNEGTAVSLLPAGRPFVEFVVSILQDLFITNLHWLFISWIVVAPMGFDLFSLQPTAKLFNVTTVEGAVILLKTLLACTLPSLLLPYSATKGELGWNHPLASFIAASERALVGPYGLFRDSAVELEDKLSAYQKGGIMFALAPHGTLPVSTWALWQQKSEIFDNVCLFFGSQIAIVPGYRFWTGARGGCMPITKKNLLRVMRKRQNVALVPGGGKASIAMPYPAIHSPLTLLRSCSLRDDEVRAAPEHQRQHQAQGVRESGDAGGL